MGLVSMEESTKKSCERRLVRTSLVSLGDNKKRKRMDQQTNKINNEEWDALINACAENNRLKREEASLISY